MPGLSRPASPPQVLVTGEEKQAVTDRALDLCLKYSFVTPLTSMVVTKPEGEGSQVLHKPKQGKPSVDVRASKRTRLRAQAFVSQFSDSDTGSLLVSRGGGRRLPGTKQSRTRFKVKNLLRNCPSCHPKVVTINQSLRILVPSAEQNLPLCFDVPVPSPLTYILLEDPKTGLVVLGKVGTSNQKGFQRVSIHAEKGGNVTADTSHIEVSWGEQSERLSWTQSSATHQSNGLLLHKQDDVLEVTVGETQVDILLHKDGSDHILWPAVKQHHLGSSAKGLMGQNRVSYEEKKTSPSVILEVQGHQHVAIRESAVDYSTPSKPTVSCWLLPHQSILQGELSAITVREP
ncbi:inter-alpha-trypsin inhibitor heavy chain H3-like isoform X3 [Arapaima gigas]